MGVKLAVLAIMGLAAWFSLRAISDYDTIVDETAHLTSWRNTYSGGGETDYLVRKLKANVRLSDELKSHLSELYVSSPAVRFMSCWITDTLGWSTVAEAARVATGSSVYGVRAISFVATLLTIPLLMAVGRAWRDADTGLWLAALFVLSPVVQLYSGIGRPYALMLLTEFFVLYQFLRTSRARGASPAPLFAAALLAQSIHFSAWFMVLPMVTWTAWREWQARLSWKGFLSTTWWYFAGSIGLASQAVVASVVSPSVGGNASMGFSGIWDRIGLVGPFGALEGIDADTLRLLAVTAFMAIIAIGLWSCLRAAHRDRVDTYVATSGLLMAMAGAFVAGGQVRHLLAYLPVPLLLAASGAKTVLGASTAGRLGMATVVASMAALATINPVDGYRRLLPDEARFSQLAEWLRRHVTDNTSWTVQPYYYSNPVYQYGPLRPPYLPTSDSDFIDFVGSRSQSMPVLVIITDEDAQRFGDLLTEKPSARFERHTGDLLVFQLGPMAGGSAPPETHADHDRKPGERTRGRTHRSGDEADKSGSAGR